MCRWRNNAAIILLAFSLIGGAAAGAPGLAPETRVLLSQLEILRGGDLAASDLTGKPVIVAFFASWCVPCRAEFTILRQLIARVGSENVEVVAVNWLEDVGHYPAESTRLMRMLDRVDPHITAVEGTKAVAQAFGGIGSLPALFVFDGDGQSLLRFVYEEGSTRTHLSLDELIMSLPAR
ncbi:MAG: TlpA disulfide reductase family protein [Alphaproteobacteria bacterium]